MVKRNGSTGSQKAVLTDLPILPRDLKEVDFAWELGPDVISVDGGNGKVSAWRLLDGKLQHILIPTARVRLRDTQLSSDVTTIGSTDVIKIAFMNALYGVGDGIWEVSDYPVESFSNSEMRYGSEHHVCMILAAIALMGVESDSELSLLVSAPPGHVNAVAKRMKDAFAAGDSGMGDGWWHIRVRNERKDRSYKIKRVLVVPEGVNAFAAYAYDANGNNVILPHVQTGHDMLTGNVFIADGGMGTFDGFTIKNGKINEQSIEHATDPNGGIQTHLIMPLMDYIKAEFGKAGQPAPSLNQAQVDSWLRQWAISDFREEGAYFVVNGIRLNIHLIGTRLCQQYARWLIEEKLEPAFRRGADTVLLAGGTWVYVLDDILAAYPKRNILYPAKVDHLRGIDLWELNGYGGLPLAANNKKVHRKVKA
jgi:hypothetical protein